MPKKNRKTKKKSAVLLPTEINIVDEGQSSLDVSDVIRKEKEIEARRSDNPVIEIGLEAEEAEEVLNAEANNFSVTEVASLRKVDSLAVAGRQGSINSNFSFFSDNNLTEKAELEDFDEHWNTENTSLSQNLTEYTASLTERTTILSSQTSHYTGDVSQVSSLRIEELHDSDLGEDDQMKKDEDFLEDLKTEILEGDKKEDPEMNRSLKSKVSWDSLVIKREIKIGLEDSVEPGENHKSWKERLQRMMEEKTALTEDCLTYYFPDQNIFLHKEDGFGFVSDKPTLSMTISRKDPFKGNKKVGDKIFCYDCVSTFSNIYSLWRLRPTVLLIVLRILGTLLEPPSYFSGLRENFIKENI